MVLSNILHSNLSGDHKKRDTITSNIRILLYTRFVRRAGLRGSTYTQSSIIQSIFSTPRSIHTLTRIFFAHIFCRHGICKGFVSMTSAESPQNFNNILTRRLPKTVQSERRIFSYDNSCNMHKHALRRGAKEILKFNLFTDRHHWKNHRGCSESYNCDRYDYLKTVNSQICEQKNSSLRKLSSTLAYCGFVNYRTKVKLFFMISKYEENGFFK